MSLESKREEFRRYLECAGVIDSLSKALIKLYEESNKPEDAVRFIRTWMCETCPTDDQYNSLKQDFEDATTKITELQREMSTIKGNLKRTTSEINLMLDEGMEALQADEECNSLLKKYLTPELLAQLRELRTENKATLLDVILSGLQNHDSHIGVYCPDAECYTMFADLLDPIIEEYHYGFKKCDIQPELDWGDPTCLGDLDPENEFIISTRVRVGRSLEGYPFAGKMNEDQYIEVENKCKEVFAGLDGEFKGTYTSLLDMDEETQTKMIQDHFLFKEGDKYLESAAANRYWPVGRGIFVNDAKTFLVWVNEEDHLRCISMECGGNLGSVYMRLVQGVEKLAENLPFVRSERLGFLCFCPSNVGTTLRASAHIKLPKLGADDEKLKEVADRNNLQVRGTSGENSEVEEGVYDISNKRRLGLTEYDNVKEMSDGITELIHIEQNMVLNESVEDTPKDGKEATPSITPSKDATKPAATPGKDAAKAAPAPPAKDAAKAAPAPPAKDAAKAAPAPPAKDAAKAAPAPPAKPAAAPPAKPAAAPPAKK